jgi:hypothetical protein
VASVHLDTDLDPEVRATLEELDPEAARKVEEALQEAGTVRSDEDAPETGEDGEASPEADEDVIMIDGKPWDRETNPFVVEWMPDWVNDWVNDEIEDSPRKGKELKQNPDLIKDKVFDVLPGTMFALLPLVALLLKVWYLFAGRYYIEHLIYALHNHSFIFVVLLIMLLLDSFAEWRDPGGEATLSTATHWVNSGLGIWIPVYMLISLKRVYRQGWGMTVAKYAAIGISYLALLALTTVFVALLSFVLL